jgi:hypothetical protein
MNECKKNLAGIGEPMVPTFGGLANIDPKANRKFYDTQKSAKSKILFKFLINQSIFKRRITVNARMQFGDFMLNMNLKVREFKSPKGPIYNFSEKTL